MTAAIRRRVLLPPDTRLPELRMLGRSIQTGAAELGLERHQHPGTWELCWFARGTADWWVGGEVHELAAGWCYLTRPDEEHGSCSGLLEACDLHWLQFTHLPGMEADDATALLAALQRTPHAFPARDLGELWPALWSALARRDGLAPLAARTALHCLLTAALTAAATPPPRPSRPIARVLARADEGHASVTALARAAGLSRSALHERFHAELGDSPAAWLRRRRLREAKRQLAATDRPVTAIAQDCGFATSQRFATAFRLATGLAPQAWRTRVRTFAAG
jgi:AraC-like DNA-binding protein